MYVDGIFTAQIWRYQWNCDVALLPDKQIISHPQLLNELFFENCDLIWKLGANKYKQL